MIDCCTDARNTLVDILCGKCHLCGGKLKEIKLKKPMLPSMIMCLRCNASASSVNYGEAYIKFADKI